MQGHSTLRGFRKPHGSRSTSNRVLLAGLFCLGALTLPAHGQSPAYQQVFPGIPSDALCSLEMAGGSGANTATLTGRRADGTTLGTRNYDLSNGKARKEPLAAVFGQQASQVATVVLQTTRPADAELTCVRDLGAIIFPMPWGPWSYRLTSGYTLRAEEFTTREMTILTESPAAVFFSGGGAPAEWRNTIIAANLDGDASPLLKFETPQFYPPSSNLNDHTAWRSLLRGATASFSLDDVLSRSAVLNSRNGAVSLRNASQAAIPVFARQVFSTGITSIPISLQTEQAAQELYLPHVFARSSATRDPAQWQNAIALVNPAARKATVFLTPFDNAGKALAEVVVEIPPNSTISRLTDELLRGVPGYERTEWIRAACNERIHALSLYRYQQHIISLSAATRLDFFREGLALRAMSANSKVSSYALLNPGERAETVRATAYDTNGSIVRIPNAQGALQDNVTLTLAPRTKAADSISGLFKTTPERLANVAYVRFQVTTPAEATVDVRNPVGRVTGIAINAEYDGALHIEGSTLRNQDETRLLLETNRYNPRNRTDWFEFNDGPVTITSTVITRDGTTNKLTYNPRADGDLTFAVSATLTDTASRRFHTSARTVDGPKYGAIGFKVDPVDNVTMQPLITISGQDASGTPRSQQLRSTMTVLNDIDSYPTETHGPAWKDLLKQNQEEFARILYTGRTTFVDTAWQTPTMDDFLGFASRASSDDGLGWKWLGLWDGSTQNSSIAINRYNMLPTQVDPYYIQPTIAGEQFMDDLKQFFQVGHKCVNKPGVYTAGTGIDKLYGNTALRVWGCTLPPVIRPSFEVVARMVTSGLARDANGNEDFCLSPTAQTEFQRSSGTIATWFRIANGLPGDQLALEWINPGGAVAWKPGTTLDYSGAGCYAWMIGDRTPGIWRVRLLVNGTEHFNLTYRISE